MTESTYTDFEGKILHSSWDNAFTSYKLPSPVTQCDLRPLYKIAENINTSQALPVLTVGTSIFRCSGIYTLTAGHWWPQTFKVLKKVGFVHLQWTTYTSSLKSQKLSWGPRGTMEVSEVWGFDLCWFHVTFDLHKMMKILQVPRSSNV